MITRNEIRQPMQSKLKLKFYTEYNLPTSKSEKLTSVSQKECYLVSFQREILRNIKEYFKQF